MTDLYFPRSLKPVVSKGYSMTRRNNVWSVDLADGGVRQGRDTYYDVFPVSVTLITSAMGRQAFLSFLEKVDGGASSFWMAHDFGMGIEDYQVTITSTIAESTEDGINWTITFTATAEKSPFQDLENQCLINNLPDLYGCYGDCLGSFLKIYANYETTFPRIWSNEGPAGYPPINLLASTLDSRIVYEGPQVHYISRNGNLVQSAANEWPLTFIDGVAVGRVPPEKAATNYSLNSSSPLLWRHTSILDISLVEDVDGYGVPIGNGVSTVSRSNPINFLIGSFVSLQNGDSITVQARVRGSNAICRMRFGTTSYKGGVTLNLDTGAVSGDSSNYTGKAELLSDGFYYFYATAVTDSAEDWNASIQIVAGPTSSNIEIGQGFEVQAPQSEVGASPTSYVPSTSTAAYRGPASAKVAMNGATSIDITYSDGSVVNVPSVDGYATIPQADSAWGSKYITRIDFNVDG